MEIESIEKDQVIQTIYRAIEGLSKEETARLIYCAFEKFTRDVEEHDAQSYIGYGHSISDRMQ